MSKSTSAPTSAEEAATLLLDSTVDGQSLAPVIRKMGLTDAKHIAFVIEYIRNGRHLADAYRKYHPNVTKGSAQTLGSRLLRSIDLGELCEVAGMGIGKIFELIDKMETKGKYKDATEFLMKLNGLDKTQMDINGGFTVVIKNVPSSHEVWSEKAQNENGGD
jgi:hypothetical protein